MFFTGDATSRKRVDLGGRSSKERDRQKLLEQTRLEREQRLCLKLQNRAALKIQKCFRGRKCVAIERCKVREEFYNSFGDCSRNVDLNYLNTSSGYLRQMLFFFRADNLNDLDLLVETSRKLLQFVGNGGDVMTVLADKDYTSKRALVDYRIKQLSYVCLDAVYQNRNIFKDQLLLPANCSNISTIILLEMIVTLTKPELPWAHKIVDNLANRKAFPMLRDIFLVGKNVTKTSSYPWEDVRKSTSSECITSVERVIISIASYIKKDTYSPTLDFQFSFSAQILCIPFLWRNLPYLKDIATSEFIKYHIAQMALCVHSPSNVLPRDVFDEFPGYACLLGNLLEIAGLALSQPFCDHNMVMDFAAVATYLLEMSPATNGSTEIDSSLDDEMVIEDEEKELLNSKLEEQITYAIDACLLEQLVNSLFKFKDTSSNNLLGDAAPSDEESTAVGAICSFLHAIFSTLPLERIMTVLAYRTEIVNFLWNFIRRCHANQRWPCFSKIAGYLPADAPGWLLPLSVFCPVYKYMLVIVDNEEFYEQEKPISLRDIKSLIVILRQILWELLWLVPGGTLSLQRSSFSHRSRLSFDSIKAKVKLAMSELLSQLQDWNNRRPFTSFSDFHALDAVGESFISQVLVGNTRAQEILKLAPFLVPFTSRVKIFHSQLGAARQRDGHHPVLTRYRFKIRRNQIFEDAFNQMKLLSEEGLRGSIRVSFINEVGAEEAGVDGGGIFKDFMENVTQAAFDIQYGLFKETTDHQLYPNPGSGMIHEQHLDYFHFVGTLLGKAMFEGILVDIPFATFFLCKLKQKYNYLNDLPSLDPELYRQLLFLKHYKGDVADLELYFVAVNNDYGTQTEEELLSGGKDIRVTKDNVITFIHLVANYRLNAQIRQQSIHFLRGFQQLIQKEWIEMFNEHEIQLLISGSLDCLDVDDLRANAHFSGGYNEDHHVIKLFWDVLQNFSLEHQKKFLKFVTGCSRGPLLGFKYLEPKFCIQRAGPLNARDEDLHRLPTSATCMNLLKLPPYKSREQLETKLLYAIDAEAGFDLS